MTSKGVIPYFHGFLQHGLYISCTSWVTEGRKSPQNSPILYIPNLVPFGRGILTLGSLKNNNISGSRLIHNHKKFESRIKHLYNNFLIPNWSDFISDRGKFFCSFLKNPYLLRMKNSLLSLIFQLSTAMFDT